MKKPYLIRAQKTVDDLLAEMEAWINDNPDDHDKFIAEYKRRVLELGPLMVVGPQDPQEDPLPEAL